MKISHATEQLKSISLGPVLHDKRNHRKEMPELHNEPPRSLQLETAGAQQWRLSTAMDT